uniref:EGF-like domain-containing protein n=1 Tax=Parastrongyloides trichosuri TaxID=131310 RepID=A0A0N4ZPH6_PARTI
MDKSYYGNQMINSQLNFIDIYFNHEYQTSESNYVTVTGEAQTEITNNFTIIEPNDHNGLNKQLSTVLYASTGPLSISFMNVTSEALKNIDFGNTNEVTEHPSLLFFINSQLVNISQTKNYIDQIKIKSNNKVKVFAVIYDKQYLESASFLVEDVKNVYTTDIRNQNDIYNSVSWFLYNLCNDSKTPTTTTEAPISYCLNGGSLNGNTCYCNNGYKGNICQIPICNVKNDNITIDENNESKSIMFVVENIGNSGKINNMNNEIISQLNQFSFQVSKEYTIDRFTGVSFDHTNKTLFISAADYSTFANTFCQILLNPPSFTGNGTNMITGIEKALAFVTGSPTIMYVFSTNYASDIANITSVLNRLAVANVQINLIYVYNSEFDNPFVDGNNYFTTMSQLSFASGGRTMTFLNSDNSFNQFMKGYIYDTISENKLIDTKSSKYSTTSKVTLNFSIDYRSKWFTITLLGVGVNIDSRIKLFIENNTEHVIQDNEKSIWSYGYTVIQIKNPIDSFIGNWRIEVTTLNIPLQIQIRSSSELNTRIGFVSTVFEDFPHTIPGFYFGYAIKRSVIFRINKDIAEKNLITYDKFIIRTFSIYSDSYTNSTSSSVVEKDIDTCSYQYGTLQFYLSISNTTYDNVAMELYGKDEQGINLKEIFMFSVYNVICLNGGTRSKDTGFCVCPPGYQSEDCGIKI